MAEEFTEAVKDGVVWSQGPGGAPSQEVLCQQHSTRKLHAPLEVSTAKAAGACLGVRSPEPKRNPSSPAPSTDRALTSCLVAKKTCLQGPDSLLDRRQ